MVAIKLFVLCVGFFAINIKKSQAVTDQEKKDVLAVLTPIIVDCSAEHDVSDELLKGLQKSGDYKDVDPCFLACILKKIKLFDGEGKYDVVKAKEVNTKFVSSEDDKKKIGEAIDECSSVNDKDVSDGDKGCERAALLFDCMLPHKELFW